jgi:DNA-binding GntR family transcriptional regulator
MRVTQKYQEIAAKLSAQIKSGEYVYGDELPSEAELKAQFGVSRGTVRRAFLALERNGLIVTRHGQRRTVAAVIGPGGDPYQAVVDGLTRDIRAGRYVVGVDRVPWKHALATEYGVSSRQAHRALNHLFAIGVLSARPETRGLVLRMPDKG